LSGTKKGNCFDWCLGNCMKKPRGELWDIFNIKIPEKKSEEKEIKNESG